MTWFRAWRKHSLPPPPFLTPLRLLIYALPVICTGGNTIHRQRLSEIFERRLSQDRGRGMDIVEEIENMRENYRIGEENFGLGSSTCGGFQG